MTKIEKPLPRTVNFVLGGIAGIASITLVQPADLVKTRMQLRGIDGKPQLGFVGTSAEIRRREGWRGFYSGLSAAMFRQATYGTARLGCFYCLFDWYRHEYHQLPSLGAKLAMGMMAGAGGAIVGTPSEVALIRMTADGRLPVSQRRNYGNVFQCLRRIAREEGVGTLWQGTTSTVIRAMVVNAAELGTYAQARQMLLPSMGDNIKLHFVASMISGFVTTAVSLPFDIIKTRVQNAPRGASQVAILRDVLKREGVLAMWRGFWPTYAKLGPLTVYIFVILEQLNVLYRTYVTWDEFGPPMPAKISDKHDNIKKK